MVGKTGVVESIEEDNDDFLENRWNDAKQSHIKCPVCDNKVRLADIIQRISLLYAKQVLVTLS